MVDYEAEIKGMIEKATGFKDAILEAPKNPEMGDYAFPCFVLAKETKKNPAVIAKELEMKVIPSEGIVKIEAAGPYLNFFVDKTGIIEGTIKAVLKEKDKFGSSNIGKGRKALIEHTSVNPNASPHLGRARNAMIGDSIVRILGFQGYKTEAHYFVNDIGKQIAMLAIACRGNENVTFKKLLDIYIEISKKAEEEPEFEKEVFEMLNKLEAGDEKTKEEFSRVVDICIEGQKKIFQDFGIKYDFFDHESKFLWDKRLHDVLDKLEKTGKLFVDEDNRKVLDLKEFKIPMENPVLVVTRADGTSLYPLRDIVYHIEKLGRAKDNFVVLGEDHKLYFMQLSAALKILGYDAPKVIHYSFVLLNEGKMSTRKGNVVLLEDFMKEAKEKAEAEIKKRYEDADADDIEEKAKMIGYGAVKYSVLKVSAEKNVIFDWETALNFEGDSAPYIQYSHARIASVLAKFDGKLPSDAEFSKLSDKEEINLAVKLGEFTKVVMKAAEDLKPHIIANYASELAQRFNEFYHKCPILQAEDDELADARIMLAAATKQVLKNSLFLLGIDAPERM